MKWVEWMEKNTVYVGRLASMRGSASISSG